MRVYLQRSRDGLVLLLRKWLQPTAAAAIVYYRNGRIAIGTWGQTVRMTPDVAGVRQNLHLLIDHGRAAPTPSCCLGVTFPRAP